MYGLYLCFIMILGDNSQFPHLFGINPAEPENPFFHVFDFQGPNDVQMSYEFTGVIILEGGRPRSKRSQRTEAGGPKGGSHAATVPGRVGPSILALRPPIVYFFCS